MQCRRTPRFALAGAVCAGAFALAACGGPDPSAFKNKVFYEYGGLGAAGGDITHFERPHPPLDLAPTYIGVSILDDAVRMSRPRDWIIRQASLEPEKRFIQYVSPRELIFAIYERVESPSDPWRVVMGRYEAEVQKGGGQVMGKAVPAAVWTDQARAYTVRRDVAAPKAPFTNYAREYLVRSAHRIVLVQVVHQGDTLESSTDELLRVFDTLQVL